MYDMNNPYGMFTTTPATVPATGYGSLTAQPPVQPQLPKQRIPQVNGREGANAYQLAPGSSVILIDNSESNTIWVKVTDDGGFAKLKKWKLVEVEENPQTTPMVDYVSKKDFDDLKERVDKLMKELGNDDK